MISLSISFLWYKLCAQTTIPGQYVIVIFLEDEILIPFSVS